MDQIKKVERSSVGTIAGLYALLYATYRDVLKATHSGAARSMASALVCVPVLALAWNLVRVFDQATAFWVVVEYSRSWLLLAFVGVCTAVDWMFVQGGKADKWALAVADQWPSAQRHRGLICAASLAVAMLAFFVPPFH